MANMISHVRGETDSQLVELTLSDLLRRSAAQTPDNEAIVSAHQNVRLTYSELNKISDDFAKGLLEFGLKPGERIGIWSPNNYQWIVAMYAAAKAGLILVNVNPAYRAYELEFALNKVGCKALVMADAFKTSDYPAILEEISPEIIQSEVSQRKIERIPSLEVLVIMSDVPRHGYTGFDQVVQIGATSTLDIEPIIAASQHDMPVNIQFTSGTTGSPKGVALTHHNIVNNGMLCGRGINLSSIDRLAMPVPLYHCFGMVLGALACVECGATLVLPDEHFDPESTLAAIQNEKCTALYGVPTMFSAMLDYEKFADYDLSSLRTGIVAGSLCAEVLMERIISSMHMPEITNAYGMTETSPASFQSAVDERFIRRTTTIGTVHPHVEAKIIDEYGIIVPRGTRGELCTKGYIVMQGYWEDEAKTKESIIDGWMHTGDEAVIDDEGYCSIVGRIKDTIIRGGENIAPKEIEEFLSKHDAIMDVQAFGVRDDKFGEAVCVWIKPVEGVQLTTETVIAYCSGKIAHFKVPAYVKFVNDFPLTVSGKVQKYVMREQMENELDGS